jgi:hypothetical protein
MQVRRYATKPIKGDKMPTVYEAIGEGISMDKKVLIAIGAVILAVIAGLIGYSQMPKSGDSSGIATDDPAIKEHEWAKAKAKELKGDFDKLSAEDKARVIKQWGLQYAKASFKRYAAEP